MKTKSLVMVVTILFAFTAKSIQATAGNIQENYSYTFQIKEVNDLASAKQVNDILRSVFDVVPSFDVNSKTFSVRTEAIIYEDDFIQRLSDNGYELDWFKSNLPSKLINTNNQK